MARIEIVRWQCKCGVMVDVPKDADSPHGWARVALSWHDDDDGDDTRVNDTVCPACVELVLAVIQ